MKKFLEMVRVRWGRVPRDVCCRDRGCGVDLDGACAAEVPRMKAGVGVSREILTKCQLHTEQRGYVTGRGQ